MNRTEEPLFTRIHRSLADHYQMFYGRENTEVNRTLVAKEMQNALGLPLATEILRHAIICDLSNNHQTDIDSWNIRATVIVQVDHTITGFFEYHLDESWFTPKTRDYMES